MRLGGRLRNRISDSTTAVALERSLGASWELTWGYVDSTTAVGLEERFGGVFGCRLGGSSHIGFYHRGRAPGAFWVQTWSVEFRILPPRSGSRRVLGMAPGIGFGKDVGGFWEEN